MRSRQKKESYANKDKPGINKDDIDKNEMPNIKDIVENSLIKDYQKYVGYRERNKWTRENLKIHELLSTLVTTNSLNADNEGVIINILCPAGRIISVAGRNSLHIGYKESPHLFELKVESSNGVEIEPDTNIRIFKDTVFKKRTEICSMKYRDVSMLNYSDTPNLFKRRNELYIFDQGIELKGEDHLRMSVINPDIDINIIKFNLGADLWTQYDDAM